MKKEKVIYARRVAYELRRQGFNIVRVEPNPHKPEFDAYVFEDTQALADALTAISNKQ